ncbi:MAG: hypothetical protein NTV01_05515 [Bacteroidia bacterium]|nr:hypothetical protein [Bacteroidia bacterium]
MIHAGNRTVPNQLIVQAPKGPNKRIPLAQIRDPSEILEPLLKGSHSVIAGRLAGAFRNNNQARLADEIIKTMDAAGFMVRESDPFEFVQPGETADHDPIEWYWQLFSPSVVAGLLKAFDLAGFRSKFEDDFPYLQITPLGMEALYPVPSLAKLSFKKVETLTPVRKPIKRKA